MSWVKTSADFAEHSGLVSEAIGWWDINHPEEFLDVTQACAEYALRLGKPRDWFRLSTEQNPERVEEIIRQSTQECPLCGRILSFKKMTLCPKANPRQYSGVFVCGALEDEAEVDCAYVAYTTEGLLDVRNKLLQGRFDEIKKVEG